MSRNWWRRWNMADNRLPPQPLPDLSDPEMRHEHRDVNVWAVGKVGIALILTTIASLLLMFGVFRYFGLNVRPEVVADHPDAAAKELRCCVRMVSNDLGTHI